MQPHFRIAHALFASLAAIACAYALSGQAPSRAAETGKPQYGDYGFDTAGVDRSIKPGDDFFSFANGTWVKNTPIPPDKSNYGSFFVLDDRAREQTRAVIEEAMSDPASKIGAAYATYLDTAAIEAKGLAPIKPWLEKIAALSEKSAYA